MLQARSVIGVLALLFCMKGAYALPRLYWIDHSDNVLRQYDGTATSAYDTSSLRILYGAMCEANGYLYFSHLGAIANEATIRRSTTNLTLSDSYTVPTTLDRQFTGLEVLPDESNFLFSDSITLYSAADAGGILSKSNLIDHADGLRFGRGIKVDEDNGKIYWVDSGVSLLTDTAANAIKRSNLDGTSVENLVSVGSVRDIALDLTNNKLYWADNANTPTIKRANLDGSSVETLITSGLTYVTGIGVDTTASKIYWLDLGSGTIKQSNLNGSSITTVVSEIGYGSALL
jgi:hypothetical protein